MKRIILFILIGLAVITLGCTEEKVEKQTTPTTITPQTTPSEETIPVNTTEIDNLLNYLNEIESIDFNI